LARLGIRKNNPFFVEYSHFCKIIQSWIMQISKKIKLTGKQMAVSQNESRSRRKQIFFRSSAFPRFNDWVVVQNLRL